MSILAAFCVLTITVTVFILWPFLRRRAESLPADNSFDVAVYKDQLNEIDQEIERGQISEAQASSIRLEIQKRLLKAHAMGTDGRTESQAGSRPFVIGLILLVPISAVLTYLALGSPGLPDYPYAERTDLQQAADDARPVNDMVSGLEARLAENPADPDGWALLGRSYLALERFEEAARAFDHLFRITGDMNVLSDFVEARIMANRAFVDEKMHEILTRVLLDAPHNPKARFYLGIHAIQNDDAETAIQIWTDLIHISPPDAAWVPLVRQHINRTAEAASIDVSVFKPSSSARDLIPDETPRGPTQEDIENAAELTADEQMEMIRSMVQRLADRLEENPNDPEGWSRLIQSYEVLGETEKATEARKAAEPYLEF